MRLKNSLLLRIAVAVALVILLAAIATAIYVNGELADGDPAGPQQALEYSELLLLLAPFAVAAPLAAIVTAAWSLRPLARIERDAEAVSPEALHKRLSEDRAPVEAVGLVRAVNGALERLTTAYQHERQFTANAAHALRTPLSVLSLRLQRAADEGQIAPAIYQQDLARLTKVVDQVLTLRRLDTHESDSTERFDLSRLVREAAANLLPLAECEGRSIEVTGEDLIFAYAGRQIIGEAIRNLIENAVVHGKGTVEAQIGISDSMVWVEVHDEGAGPDPATREMLMQRFVRGKHSPGSGLGLAIARNAAESFGGTLDWGSGSRIRLSLPVSRDRHAKLI